MITVKDIKERIKFLPDDMPVGISYNDNGKEYFDFLENDSISIEQMFDDTDNGEEFVGEAMFFSVNNTTNEC